MLWVVLLWYSCKYNMFVRNMDRRLENVFCNIFDDKYFCLEEDLLYLFFYVLRVCVF